MQTYRLLPLLVLLVLLSQVELASARSVYLKDGAILDCESFWRTGDKVVVMVNRDTMLTFTKQDVDQNKTFARRSHPSAKRRAHRATVSHRPAISQTESATASLPVEQHPAAVPIKVATAAPVQVPATQPAGKVATHPSTPAGAAEAPGAGPNRNPVPTVLPPPVPVVMPGDTATPSPAATLAKVGTTALTAVVGVFLIITLLMVASHWKIYEKAGQAGWKCLIPFYNMYILVLITGKPWWWFLVMFVPVVGVAIYLLMMLALAERFGKGPLFGIGLFFIPIICFPLLAFDNSEYLGGPLAI